ncbi:MAG: beta-ketoacyl-[acyl-carrier-protein] synthase family protein [Denitromonas halophila]|nr:MAG: beta-ketoacyl-[acyl-carrier-protein] synthase family protein [Denitromonas halophila]TVT73298.1 MAG: beta-ketoacyl-[acyl-carrier-protein] synthase family protein [Denitromonas halophila]
MNMAPLITLPALGLVNALGHDTASVSHALFRGDTTGMVRENGWLPQRAARVGRARIPDLPALPAELAHYDSRNNRLLLAALRQIEDAVRATIARVGAHRVGVVLGTSTSGILEGEAAVAHHAQHGTLPPGFQYGRQELGDCARFLADALALTGPAYTVSTACTSSAKAMISAQHLICTGLCDAVIAGGVDTLCRLTINGFSALEATSAELCNPMSANRRGINIGEGAALFLVCRDPAAIALLGAGESSDAHHISSPEPNGKGAEAAIRQALAAAGADSEDVSYLNLHGTATPKNDEMESRAVARLFPKGVPCSSTKPLTGHTLGAAGATELAFCWLALSHHNVDRRLPAHVWDGCADPALPELNLVRIGDTIDRHTHRIMLSSSFAFGGSNCCLAIGDAP